jgi:glycerophosphoryl diester phosphodiesterase
VQKFKTRHVVEARRQALLLHFWRGSLECSPRCSTQSESVLPIPWWSQPFARLGRWARNFGLRRGPRSGPVVYPRGLATLPMAPRSFPRSGPVRYLRPITLFAHRGLAAYAAENTGPAVVLAAAAGANGIELDVRFTADDVPVLFHDNYFAGPKGAKTTIEQLTLPELRLLRLPPAVPVPTLAELFAEARDFSWIILDLKDFNRGRGSTAKMDLIARLVARHGLLDRVIVDSGALEWVHHAQEHGLLASLRVPTLSPRELARQRIQRITLEAPVGRAYHRAHGWGHLIVCGICPDSIDDMLWFYDSGAHGVITDRVEEALAALRRRGWVEYHGDATVPLAA